MSDDPAQQPKRLRLLPVEHDPFGKEQPPQPGFLKAPDGNWYTPHPSLKDRWLQWVGPAKQTTE